MTAQQRAEHRDLYVQLRLAIADPGDSFAGARIPYTPINFKDDWDFDYALTQPDTAGVTYLRQRGYKTRLLGKHEQGRAAAA